MVSEDAKSAKRAAREAFAKLPAEERARLLAEKAARCAAERADALVARAHEAKAMLDGVGVQRLCSAALQLVPGHVEALGLLAGHPHGWDCMCLPCRKGLYPSSKEGRVSVLDDMNTKPHKGDAGRALREQAERLARVEAEKDAMQKRAKAAEDHAALLAAELEARGRVVGTPVEDVPQGDGKGKGVDLAGRPLKPSGEA